MIGKLYILEWFIAWRWHTSDRRFYKTTALVHYLMCASVLCVLVCVLVSYMYVCWCLVCAVPHCYNVCVLLAASQLHLSRPLAPRCPEAQTTLIMKLAEQIEEME